ncbi:MAG: hypothetical protein AUK16_02070 [Parcubacteria group bacterium CG2_30_44_11]|nr:MAG: hypothetical protein AUK16_02070 [Parcubacteria group bacterium CG2_30_44_11]
MQKPRPAYKYNPTEAQKNELTALRKTFGTRGYFIFPVASWYRRTEDDFLASPKLEPHQVILVRPTKTGQIEMRPYVLKASFTHLIKEIKARQVKYCSVRWRAGLPAPTKNYREDWQLFYPEEFWEEIGRPQYYQP